MSSEQKDKEKPMGQDEFEKTLSGWKADIEKYDITRGKGMCGFNSVTQRYIGLTGFHKSETNDNTISMTYYENVSSGKDVEYEKDWTKWEDVLKSWAKETGGKVRIYSDTQTRTSSCSPMHMKSFSIQCESKNASYKFLQELGF